MNILDKILAHKQREVAEAQADVPWRDMVAQAEAMPPPRDMRSALRRSDGAISIIAEIKRASPSSGWIRQDADPAAVAQQYAAAGADALSVLTDETFFAGHPSFLPAIRAVANVPLLRKDFIVDDYQIYEARALGADAVLLIVAALTPDQLTEFSRLAAGLGMAALIEVHDGDEMALALDRGATLIGVNHRNLATMTIDRALGEALVARMPADVTAVAESGIASHGDLMRMQAAGFHAALIGEAFMRQPDPGVALRAFREGEVA